MEGGDHTLETLRDVFGHDAFRQGQREVIDGILSGRPTLAVMPTGSGKSLCYQLPAVLLEGTTIVVSPLIALIYDQVGALRERGVAAASLTSADAPDDRRRAMEALAKGELSLLYVAPERFKQGDFMKALTRAQISLFVVDEAHCISEWGHDFRPDYAKLGEVIATLSPDRVACFTATATPKVQNDILASLALPDARSIVTGFDRPNLHLSVEQSQRGADKVLTTAVALRTWMQDDGGSAIVYVATRKSSEELAAALGQSGFSAAAYHAGLSSETRTKVQDDFQNESVRVVVATSAFGMGVDKENVRVVVHYHVPSSLEAYYQEVGRAGRDGLPAGGVLVYHQSDLRYALMRLEASCPKYPTVEAALAFAADMAARSPDGRGPQHLDQLAEELAQRLGSSARAAVVALEKSGDLLFDAGRLVVRRRTPSLPPKAFERRERHERAKLDAMIGYVQRAPCRRRYLVDYFGDPRRPPRCGVCDRCKAPDARPLSEEQLAHAQMALSCIARMRGRFGRNRVIEVLTGSTKHPLLAAGLDRLSTYGLLADWSKEEVSVLLDGLLRAGLARITTEEYPRMVITEEGAEALRSRSPVELDIRLKRWGDRVETPIASGRSRAKRARKEAEAALSREDAALFESLRRWRSKTASEIEKPAYVVASDAVLRSIATVRPSTKDALSNVPGIGPAKLDRYGDQILEIINDSRDG